MHIETLAVHAGYSPDPTTKSAAVPLYQTVAYAFDSAQHGADLFDLKVPGNIYTRIMNPTNDVLEKRVAALEGGIAALAMASGMAAITAAIQTIAETGDNIISASTLYGGTYNLFAHTFPQQGIEVRFADPRDPASFAALIDARTKAVFCESIGNPLGNVTDIAALAKVAHDHGVPLIVDTTVPSPYLCRPIEHGADIVVHALTKYMNGHGNSIGGIIVDSGKFPWAEHKERFKRLNEPDVSYHGVVYTEALGAAAYIGQSTQIGHIAQWVANRFTKNGLGARINQRGKGFWLAWVGKAHLNALLRKGVGKQVVSAAIQRAGADDVVASFGNGLDGRRNRRHAGRHGHRRNAAFQRRDALFQHIGGRVHDAGVDIARRFQIEQVGAVLGAVEGVGHGLVDRHRDRARGRVR